MLLFQGLGVGFFFPPLSIQENTRIIFSYLQDTDADIKEIHQGETTKHSCYNNICTLKHTQGGRFQRIFLNAF